MMNKIIDVSSYMKASVTGKKAIKVASLIAFALLSNSNDSIVKADQPVHCKFIFPFFYSIIDNHIRIYNC